MPSLSLSLKVKPGSRRPQPPVYKNDMLELSVQAPPVDGKANAAVIAALSDLFDLPKSAFELTHGTSGRQKRVLINTSDAQIAAVQKILAALSLSQ